MASIVDKRVRRLDVLVDEALPVGVAECFRQTDGCAQEASQIDRLSIFLLDYAIQGFATWIFKNEDRSPLVTGECERLSCPSRIEFGRQRVFVFEPPKTLERRLFSGNHHSQDRRVVAALSAAIESEVRPLVKRL
jgi:hypothetical protein